MNHDILKRVIFDEHDIIKNTTIVDRPEYQFEDNLNYVLVGLRRSGKSTLLYKKVQELVKNGVDYNQIIYITFEDERLIEFNSNDFDDILEVANELSSLKKYYFFDEIQNIDGWELFSRRMADKKEFVYITGSNAKMLSREMDAKLGGRYISRYITPYSFIEFVSANNQKIDYSSKGAGILNNLFNTYMEYGGLPETVGLVNKKEYIRSVYQKVLLNDIILHNNVRNESTLRLAVKKIAETIKDELSYTKLHNVLKSIGFTVSKDTLIDYVLYIINSYLIFDIRNYYASFVDKESTPKYYFTDNGILNLFLADKKGILLENLVATHLKRKYNEDLYYIKNTKSDVDVDFYIPEKYAIQVTYTLDDVKDKTYNREINSLLKLKDSLKHNEELIIISTDKSRIIEEDNTKIKLINIVDFLLNY